jgi:fimbrial chaperone protein
MLRSTAARWPLRLLLVGLALGQAHRAGAAVFTINPTVVTLTPKASSALLSLKNDSDEPIRFQVTAYGWNQNAAGEMDLKPTEDVVFYPALFTLGPKQERKIRIGTTAAFGQTERNYRVFIEELPPTAQQAAQSGVRVLTRMGIPVFLQPAAPRASAALEDISRTKGVFSFVLRNTGNVHFVPERIHVKALDATGKVLLEKDLSGWYVLAGGLRNFVFEAKRPECEAVRSLVVEVKIGNNVLDGRLETPTGACGG